jgi:hypothetical protein
MQKCLIVCFLFIIGSIKSQSKTDSEFTITKKPVNWDTLKYQKFERVLIIGLFQQHRTFSNEFKQIGNKDTLGLSMHTYSTEIDFTGAAGIVINYDKFQLSLSKGVNPPTNAGSKGHSDIFNIGLNVGDNRWVSENYFRRFKGFYNVNSPSFDSLNFSKTGKYFLQPSMLSSLFMTRFMHFRNYRNYAYKAGFGCNYRQLKNAISLVYGASFSVFNLKNDSSIIPLKSRNLFQDFGNLKGFQSVNLGANLGVAATIVIYKAWFAAGYFTLGPEQQWRNYNLTDTHRNLSYIGWSGTGRFSLGLNMKKFYLITSFATDYNVYNSPKVMEYKTTSYTTNTTFGWRFHRETPKFYQKFMSSKLYSYL